MPRIQAEASTAMNRKLRGVYLEGLRVHPSVGKAVLQGKTGKDLVVIAVEFESGKDQVALTPPDG